MQMYVIIMILFCAGWYPAYRYARPGLKRLIGPRYVASFAIVVFGGCFAPSGVLFHLLLIVTFVATVKDREDIMARYVMFLALIPPINLNLAIGAGGMYLGRYEAIVPFTVGALIATVVKPAGRRAALPRRFGVEDMLAIVVIAVFTLATTGFDGFTGTLRNLATTALGWIAPYCLFRRNVRTAEEVQRLIACLAVAALSIAVIALYESRVGFAVFDAINSRLSTTATTAAGMLRRGTAIRAPATFVHPLMLAYFLLIAIVAMLCSRSQFKNRDVWLGMIVLMFLAAKTPQSRGLVLSLVPTLMVLLVTHRRFGMAAGLLAGAGIGGGILYALKRDSANFLFQANGYGQYYDYRELLLHRGVEEGLKHPIFGQRMAGVMVSLHDLVQGEHIIDLVNTYLNIFLVSGFVGLLAFVACAAAMMRHLIARARRGEDIEAIRSSRAFLLAALSGSLIFIFFTSFGDRLPAMFLMLAAFSRVVSTLR